jgi:hypothetical protein
LAFCGDVSLALDFAGRDFGIFSFLFRLLTSPAGKHITELFRYILERRLAAVSIDALKLRGMRPVDLLKFLSFDDRFRILNFGRVSCLSGRNIGLCND